MTDEEKKAIEYFKENINYFQEQIKFIETVDCDYYDEEYELYKNRVKQFKTVLNLIQKQQAEIEKKDKIIDEMAARVYLNEEEREEMKKDIYNNVNHKGFADFVKRYFEMKVRKEND